MNRTSEKKSGFRITAILSNNKIREELLIGFGLIAVTILVLVGYLFPGRISPFITNRFLPFVVGLGLLIAFFGFIIIAQMIEPVLRITREAKLIARGDLTREIKLAREDELGDLALALNAMTQRIRHNVEELKKLSQTTGTINAEINRRIASLSDMIDLSNRIAQNEPLEDVVKAAIEKVLITHGMTMGCVILKDPATSAFKVCSLQGSRLQDLITRGAQNLTVQLGEGLLGKALLRQKMTLVNQATPPTKDADDFQKVLLVRSAAIVPISSKGNAFGLFIIGHEREEFSFEPSELELLQMVSKNLAIAVMNSLLTKEIERFEVTDALTGLFNNAFSRTKLAQEIKDAMNNQRSCSFILFQLNPFKEFYDRFGHIPAEDILIKTASILKRRIGEKDCAARFSDNEFALILPLKNKKEAIGMAAKILGEVEGLLAKETPAGYKPLTCIAVVVENPIDGTNADELILKSGILLRDTRDQGTKKIGT